MSEIDKAALYFEPIKQKALEILNEENFQKEIIFAASHIKKNPKLAKDKEGVLREVYNAMNLGFTLNPILDYGNLIPVWSGGMTVQFRPTYKGLLWSAKAFGAISDIYAYVVYKGDEFKMNLGTVMTLDHSPKFETKEIERVYAVATLPDGSRKIEVMDQQDIEQIKKASDGYQAFKANKIKSNPWHDYEAEMWRKTCIKRLCKYLPKNERFERAVEADNREYMIDPLGNKAEFIRSLLNNSVYDERMRQHIENSMHDMSTFKASELINELKENQLNPIDSGQNYGQGDILKQIDKKNENEND